MLRFLWRRFIAGTLSRSLAARLTPELEARIASAVAACCASAQSEILAAVESMMAVSGEPRQPGAFILPPEFQSTVIEDEHGAPFLVVVSADNPGVYERWVMETRHYSEIARLLRHLLQGAGTLIDLGANIGTVSLPVALTGSHVIAVEMLPQNALRLTLAARANDFSHFRVVQAAVTNQDSMIGFAGDEGWGHVVPAVGAAQAVGLRLDTIVGLVKRENPGLFKPPVVLKIDIEGHEYSALAGADELLSVHRPPFVFESIQHAGSPPEDAQQLKNLVTERGYAMYVIRNRVLSAYAADDVQIGLVSDMLALPLEKQDYLKNLLTYYEFRDLSPIEQIAWLDEMAHAEVAHRTHAAAVIPWLRDRLPEQQFQISEIANLLMTDPNQEVVVAAMSVS